MIEPNLPNDPDKWGLDLPLTPDSLGVDLSPVHLTQAEKRAAFRALNVLAWIASLGADWAVLDGQDADSLRTLARVILPEGIGIELEAGE
jgi:hypothetical protein